MKRHWKKWLCAGVILLTLAAVLYIGAKNGDFPASMRAMLEIPPVYVLLCVACVFGGILMECLSFGSALRALGHRMRLGMLYAISVLGDFYGFITPGASGGQPMQVYQFHKCAVPVGDATAALTIHFQVFQLTLLICDVPLFLWHREFIAAQLGANLPILIVGYACTAMILAMSLMITFYQRPVRWLLARADGLMRRFKIGNPEALLKLLNGLADGYFTGMRRLASDSREMARQFGIALMRLMLMMSVICLVYRGLGLCAVPYGSIVALGCMQYTSAAYTPLPGASGMQEGVFSLYFEGLFPGEKLLSALLVWRFVTYYLVLIVGFIVVAALGMRGASVDEVQADMLREISEERGKPPVS